MGLSYNEYVLIIIIGAAVSVVIGFAMFRLYFSQRDESPFQMSNEQMAYIRSVKERNMEAMMMEAGSGRRH